MPNRRRTVIRDDRGAGLGEKQLRHIGRQRGAGRMGALQQRPVVAVAGAVVQFALVPDRRPVVLVRGQQDRAGQADFLVARLEGPHDRRDLRRMDAPFAQEAQFGAGTARVVAGALRVLDIGADVVLPNKELAE